MATQLSAWEIQLLDKIVPTRTLSEAKGIRIALRNYIADSRDAIIAERNISEAEFKTLQVQTVNNIFAFLIENDFVGEREGGVNFLTEKGKNLRVQGSLERYETWRKGVRAENKVIIHTIETRGYLDQDEIVRNRKQKVLETVRKFILYPLLVIIFLALLIGVLHHLNLDKNIPFIRNLYNKGASAVQSHSDKSGGRE